MIFIKFKNLVKRHLQDNFLLYFILLVAFVVGVVIGAILINKLSHEDKIQISRYLSKIVELMSNNYDQPIDTFWSSLFSNSKTAVVIWGLGFLFIGVIITPLIIVWKGIAVGFTVGFMVKEFGIRGFIFSIASLLPHYLIILPSFLTIGAVSISNSIYRKKDKRKLFQKNYSMDYTIIFFMIFLIIVIGSMIEGFFIPRVLSIIGGSL